MTAARPVPEALLMDYAAGVTGSATGLLMAAHLAMSEESRRLFTLMEGIGGALLENTEGETLERISAAGILERLDREQDEAAADRLPKKSVLPRHSPRAGSPAAFLYDDLPHAVRTAENEIGGDRRWRWIGRGVAVTRLAVSTENERAHLLFAERQTPVASHRHVGREAVLVIKGAFWDDGVRYGPGDVAVSEDGSVHSPYIDEAEDCLCLAVTEAPVHFTGLKGLALNRFCRF